MLQQIKKLSSLALLMTFVVGLIAATSLRLHAPDLPISSETTAVKISSKQTPVVASEAFAAKPSTIEKKSTANRKAAPYESASLKVLRKAAKEGRLNGSAHRSTSKKPVVNKNQNSIGPNGTEAITFTAVRQLELRSNFLSQSN